MVAQRTGRGMASQAGLPDEQALCNGGQGDGTEYALRIEMLRVRTGRIEASVRVSSACFKNTSPALVVACLGCFPTIASHSCRNGVGPTFGHVMNATSVPHLLEHLVIDAQARATTNEDVVFTGTTQWSAEDPLVATVSVSYLDDLVALSAFKQAASFLDDALLGRR